MSHTSAKKLPWIKEGYALFAKEGLQGVSIELIAKRVGISKSSYYHHFGDFEVFMSELLVYHIYRAEGMSAKASECEQLDPDVLNLFLEYREDMFFNKQLRLHREQPEFKKCFESAYSLVEHAFIEQWAAGVQLESKTGLARLLLQLIAENFFLRITEESFDYPWFHQYIQEVSSLIFQIKQLS
ncbi:MAG: TetR/AcrR family transcriptional regulator [Bacteroidota bacterium]